jgi:glycosyltransferase involved in cell wall biosynthesis
MSASVKNTDKITYLDYLRHKPNLLIVGPYPPPHGGVSVHIERLKVQLPNSEVYDTNSLQSISISGIFQLTKFLFKPITAVHIHSYRFSVMLFAYFMKLTKRCEIIMTMHNPRIGEQSQKPWPSLYRRLFAAIDVLIVVGGHIKERILSAGLALPATVFHDNAFIMPDISQEMKIIEQYPIALLEFIEKKHPVLMAIAWRMEFDRGVDIYGLDMIIEFLARLRRQYPHCGLVFVLVDNKYNHEYVLQSLAAIESRGLAGAFFLLAGRHPLWPLFKRIDLFMRPTFSDGFGVSLAEAIAFGCPAVASDVCSRPDGTVLFHNRDIDDLYDTVLRQLQVKSGDENISVSY